VDVDHDIALEQDLMTDSMLNAEELGNVAFGLLTSSTLDRYARIAGEAAARVWPAVEPSSEQWVAVTTRAALLWGDVLGSKVREPAEVELAVLLTMLARTDVTGVDELLTTIALSSAPQARWPAALARHLWKSRNGVTS
jgi:hypothetical protein